ncbi:WD repeat-containing protein [Gaeumannomyces tritici R3-111a-1]|uniref:ASTRA-associated protein 1 n=1 Tax=Gaeumannomyces tritici (strain R3-111a-1) TaxID=644352 RepID=J3NQ00_GAET3|nr:WD repeat-containing protein [Gaeumannomyces tritici R3-111a-1]EJT78256.1 WD repeat-containing protein [Gaeumannomyces tritici R3-111a-1]
MSQSSVTGGGAPAQPRAILRGHKAQVHAAVFIRGGDRLVTGDAEGFVVVWDLTIMRPRAVWKAHEDVLLGVREWGHKRLITHGRDNKLIVWKLGEADEASLSRALPLDPSPEPRPQPWILHMLEVNTMNFCTFSLCEIEWSTSTPLPQLEALVAVPNTLALEAIDIFRLPAQRREHTVKLGGKDGMVMALELFHTGDALTLVVAYETGTAAVAQLDGGVGGGWSMLYKAKAHSQPILSLDLPPSREYFLTSSADAVIAKHPLPRSAHAAETETAPTEGGHKDAQHTELDETCPTQGDSTDSATSGPPAGANQAAPRGISLLAAALRSSETGPPGTPTPAGAKNKEPERMATEPVKITNTKHAGQQGLRVRSDGRIFATAGWDSRVRVYSCKTMKELAVLKWHQVGCYALAFAPVGPSGEGKDGTATLQAVGDSSVVPRIGDVTVKEKRIHHAKNAHWLAAGAKDGKVSLWEVY